MKDLFKATQFGRVEIEINVKFKLELKPNVNF